MDVSKQVKIERKSAWRKYRVNFNKKTAICIECPETFKLDPRSRLGWTTKMAKHSKINCGNAQNSDAMETIRFRTGDKKSKKTQNSHGDLQLLPEDDKAQNLIDTATDLVEAKMEQVKEENSGKKDASVIEISEKDIEHELSCLDNHVRGRFKRIKRELMNKFYST